MAPPEAYLVIEDETLDEAAILSQLFVTVLQSQYNVLSVKAYRLSLPTLPSIPVTPCLDHEAQLHEHDLPHMGGYVQHRESGRIMNIVYLPLERQIIVEEETEGAGPELEELMAFVRARYPSHEVKLVVPLRGSAYVRARAVAEAHVPLEMVLTGMDERKIRPHLEQLNGISVLMEKESRVSSWGIRTAYAPLMAAVAFLLVFIIPSTATTLWELTAWDWLRIALLSLCGTLFLYFGLKAVQLTKSATRLAKRIREYEFILACRHGGLCSDAGVVDERPSESPVAPQHRARIIDLLQGEPTEPQQLAQLIEGRVSAAEVVLDGARPKPTAILAGICVLRMAVVTHHKEELQQSLESLGTESHQAQVVTRRARLRRRIDGLSDKQARLKTYLDSHPVT